MLRYNVRSRLLMDLVSELNREKLIKSPYFQRKLVWRDIHKVDFIKTILLGYPFPEIFIAKGDLDVEKMTSRDYVVDGQQRLNSIVEYIEDKFPVDGKYYTDLDLETRGNFLKYEIAVIDLDLKHNDPAIKDIFMRLNRTFYSLTYIERLSTEFAPSEFMLLAKLLSGELKRDEDFFDEEIEDSDKEFNDSIIIPEVDPGIPQDFLEWAKRARVKKFNQLILDTGVFSSYEISRQVHLMFSLNIIGTILNNGYLNRNIKREIIEDFASDFNEKDEIVVKLEKVAIKILNLKLKKKSYWLNKANLFTLIYVFYKNLDSLDNIPVKDIKIQLELFENDIPEDYQLAAKEGVNNRKERNIRDDHVQKLISNLIN